LLLFSDIFFTSSSPRTNTKPCITKKLIKKKEMLGMTSVTAKHVKEFQILKKTFTPREQSQMIQTPLPTRYYGPHFGINGTHLE
jgi:hypothetical protein